MENAKRVAMLIKESQLLTTGEFAAQLIVLPLMLFFGVTGTFSGESAALSGRVSADIIAFWYMLYSLQVISRLDSRGISRLFGQLPVARQDLVRGHYLFVGVYALVGWLLGCTLIFVKLRNHLGAPAVYLLIVPLALTAIAAHLLDNQLRYGQMVGGPLDTLLLAGKTGFLALAYLPWFGSGAASFTLPTWLLFFLGLAGGAGIMLWCCQRNCRKHDTASKGS